MSDFLPGALGWLADAVPFAVPRPLARDPDGNWLIVRWVDGLPVIDGSDLLARSLGRAVAALRALDPERARIAGVPDRPEKADLARRGVVALERLPQCAARWPVGPMAEVLAEPPVPGVRQGVAHLDLYPRHVLATATGDLAGILDWGDLGVADPAIDLAIAWTLFDPPDRDAFLETVAPDPDERVRAQYLAAIYAVHLGAWGLDTGAPDLIAVADRVWRELARGAT
jgi:aminoglycoside phosphotransferase (APT) family kinase protein